MGPHFFDVGRVELGSPSGRADRFAILFAKLNKGEIRDDHGKVVTTLPASAISLP